MKSNRVFSLILALVLFGFLAVNSAHATWTVTQLTNNSHYDGRTQIYGSNVVWEGNGKIFLYDRTTTTQLTNKSY